MDSRYYRQRLPSLSDLPDSPSVYSHAYTQSPRSPFDDESTIHSLSTEHAHDDDGDYDGADDASHRISLQGPKIRFHSRAPWETDDPVPRRAEPDSSLKPGSLGSKLRGKAAKADNLIRTFTRGSNVASRPSVDSARSRVSATSSFDFTAANYFASGSRGALYDLARQSMSTTSLSSSTTSPSVRHQSSARASNYPHYFTQSHSVALESVPPLPMSLETASIRTSVSDACRVANDCSTNPSSVPFPQERPSHDDFVHPYANPDLVVYHSSFPDDPHHPVLGDVTGSDANSIITDSTSIKSAPFSVASTDTSTTSLTSRDTAHGNPRVNGKEISSPISVVHQSDITYVDRDTKFLSLHPPPVGFDAPLRSNIRSPTVTLISLQEAQARERFRSTTVHTTVARPKPPFPDSDDIPETAEDQPDDMSTARTHVRSTSAGTRYKVEESAVPMNAVPGRSLKHKKSGFMRLFGGRNPDGEKDRSPPPPIPALADVYTEETLQQTHGIGKTSRRTLSKAPKQSFSPTLRSSGASNSTLASTSSVSSSGELPGPALRRRQPPPLSIVTKSAPALAEGNLSPMGSPLSPPPMSLGVPLSAPPGSSEFPSLKLRPISVSFSSHFADIVVGEDEPQHDADTPSSAASSSTALSPFTPASARRSDDASANAVNTPNEELLTIQELQNQFTSAKKAWQQQISELRGQISGLTSELENLRAADDQEYCEACGRGDPRCRQASPFEEQHPKKIGVVNRPRARTGETARFTSRN